MRVVVLQLEKDSPSCSIIRTPTFSCKDQPLISPHAFSCKATFATRNAADMHARMQKHLHDLILRHTSSLLLTLHRLARVLILDMTEAERTSAILVSGKFRYEILAFDCVEQSTEGTY